MQNFDEPHPVQDIIPLLCLEVQQLDFRSPQLRVRNSHLTLVLTHSLSLMLSLIQNLA